MWKYYVSSFFRVEPTEGVDRDKMHRVVLARNQKVWDSDSQDGSIREPLSFSEGLGAKICANTSKMFYDPNTSDWFIYTERPFEGTRARLQKAEDDRTERFREKFVLNSTWMKGMTHEEVQKVTGDFKRWVDEGVVPGSAPAPDAATDQMVE